MDTFKLPCINCICLAICKNRDSNDKYINQAIGIFLTDLGNHCSTLFEYLNLNNLGFDCINFDHSTPMIERMHIIIPLAKRILEICEFMDWGNFELDRFKLLAQGIIPDGEQ